MRTDSFNNRRFIKLKEIEDDETKEEGKYLMQIENEAHFNVKKGEGGSIISRPSKDKFLITAKHFKQYLNADGVSEKENQVNLELTRNGFAALVGSMSAQLKIYDEEHRK